MRLSKYLLSTLKEAPADAEIKSHQLMIRAGMIRKLASGIYTWLPTGKRVLKKVEEIVRREMDKSGALECFSGVVQPAELWVESGRIDGYGDNLARFKDRKGAEFCLGPTAEEVFTVLARNEITSYRQLPLNLYQIQTKIRDETRPRFGMLRTREFVMKDAYSFHLTKESLQETYNVMVDTYRNVFNACGLKFKDVDADNGAMGGSGSKEFQVLAAAGEDVIAYCENSDYAANLEKAPAIPNFERQAATQALVKEHTPGVAAIEDVVNFKKGALNIESTVKLLVVEGATQEHPLVAVALRGDHTLNEVKAEHHPLIKAPLTLANPEKVAEVFGAQVGSLGVVNCPIYLIADATAARVSDFATGANETGYHYFGANWERDAQYNEEFDLRNAEEGDPSPCGKGTLTLTRGIECGHVFMLGDKYSKAMNCQTTTEDGKLAYLEMGCYGIGVTRVVAAAIEQNNDEWGITLPDALAPWHVALIPVNAHKSEVVKNFAEELYAKLEARGVETYYDDRGERLGVALADVDLIGVPYQLVIGEKNLNAGVVEFKERRTGAKQQVALDQLDAFLEDLIAKLPR